MSRGFVLWFTGLSGSGKSTLTAMVAAELRRRGIHVETLDGDDVRKHLSKGLGFSREDRDSNIRRIGFVARLVARSGGCAIAAAISPYREIRNEIRASIEHFCEVYTECPIEVLAERDPKGLYKKALAGEIKHFTGVDDPYQAPETPEVHLHTDRESPEQSLERIVLRLEELGLIPTDRRRLLEAASGEDPWQGLPHPHGAELPDRVLRGDLAGEARARASNAPAVTVDDRTLATLGAIATGVLSPLKGFVTSKDHRRILDAERLETGLPWAVPVTLTVPEQRAQELARADRVALKDPSGALVAIVSVHEIWRVDPGAIAIGGDVECLALPSLPSLGHSPSPRDVRVALRRQGATNVVALVSSSAPDRAAEYVLRAALETADAALILVTWTPDDEVPAARRAEAWHALFAGYFPAGRGFVVTYPDPTGVTPSRALLQRAIVAQNYGASRLIVPEGTPDFAHTAELSIHPVRVAPVGWSARAGQLATVRAAPDVDIGDPRGREYRPEVEAALGGRGR